VRILVVLVIAACIAGLLWGLSQAFPDRVGDADWPRITYQLGLIALVSASLFRQRLRLGQAVQYALVWAALIGVLLFAYSYRGEMFDAAGRLQSELLPGFAVATRTHELVISPDESGAFSIEGEVNDTPVRFLVDTGASDVVLSPQDAARIGVDPDKLDFSRHFETANGVGLGAGFVARDLSVGPIRLSNQPVSINRAPMGASLLGMSFLRQLKSYDVKGGRLYLTWQG
jgi:aspartyl protease family protein